MLPSGDASRPAAISVATRQPVQLDFGTSPEAAAPQPSRLRGAAPTPTPQEDHRAAPCVDSPPVARTYQPIFPRLFEGSDGASNASVTTVTVSPVMRGSTANGGLLAVTPSANGARRVGRSVAPRTRLKCSRADLDLELDADAGVTQKLKSQLSHEEASSNGLQRWLQSVERRLGARLLEMRAVDAGLQQHRKTLHALRASLP